MVNWRGIFVLTVISSLSFYAPALAAEPVSFITWQTNTTVPAWYTGKALPSATASISFALTVLVDGRSSNLSKNEIRWYVNNDFIEGGAGLQTITLAPEEAPVGRRLTVRAVVKNLTDGTDLVTQTQLDRAIPLVVIDAPVQPKTARAQRLTFTAVPFFFGSAARDRFDFQWIVGGLIQTLLGDTLVLDTQSADPGARIAVGVRAEDSSNPLASAESSITVTIP